jgi:predicted ferric reductase
MNAADRATPAVATRRASGPPGRLRGGSLVAIGAAVGLLLLGATEQILPATSAHQAELRIWLASRAAGFTALGLLAVQIALGLVLSHPTNKSTWRLSKRLFPWHENAWIFVLAFLAAHVVSLAADPYAGVGFAGAFIPGLSGYRSAPVALGTLALWALLATGLTARYTKLLPAGAWLSLHRISLVVFVLAWMHGLTAGSDSTPMLAFYLVTGGVVLAAGAYRYWVSRAARPSFATSLQEDPHR